jgi:chromosome segregation ATPase
MNTSTIRTALPALGLASLGMLAGCGGISDLTREHVARSETAVTQAQQTVGNSENGALELQSARDHLTEAKKAVADKKETPADRHAEQARLDAELAVAKAATATARKAADELQASIKTLRQEAGLVNPNP